MPNHKIIVLTVLTVLTTFMVFGAFLRTNAAAGLTIPLPALRAATVAKPAPTVTLPAGLTRVKAGGLSDNREDVIAVADWLYFRQGTELWKSDGTVDGTVVAVEDVAPFDLKACNGKLYFRAAKQLFSLAPASDYLQPINDDFQAPWNDATVQCSRDKLFFINNDATHGQELWQTNGEFPSTTLVKDINPGRIGSGIEKLVLFQDKVIFTAYSESAGDALWYSDGTLTGTQSLATLAAPIAEFAATQDTLFLRIGCCQLWRINTDFTGIEMVKDFSAEAEIIRLFPARTRLYLTAEQSIPDTVAFVRSSLWQTHGGTAEMQKLHTYVRHNLTYAAEVIGDRLLFEEVEYDGAVFGDRHLLISDGMITATTPLTWDMDYTRFLPDIELSQFPDQRFVVHDRTLWRTDGTITNTVALTTVRTGPHTLSPTQPTQFGERFAYTQPDDHLAGIPLWISDGTPDGTQLLVDFAPWDYGKISHLTGVNDKLFFIVNGIGDNDGLWVYQSGVEIEEQKLFLPVILHSQERFH